jgi:hypothetical protein
MQHPLQKAWVNVADEQDYVRAIEAMVHDGQLDAAAARLTQDISTIGGPVADLCRNIAQENTILEGWDDLNTAISQYEGDPITAVHIIVSNAADLVFEAKSDLYEPIVDVAYYSDAHLAFSALSRDEILAESLTHAPAWYGQSEDIEAYLDFKGLAPLNTALLRHPTQYFLRPQVGEPAISEAPIAYVTYVLASLFRAICVHKAIKTRLDQDGVTGNIPVIVGIDNIRHAIGSVYQSQVAYATAAPEVASLALKIKPREIEVSPEISGTSIRRRLAEQAANDGEDEEPTAPVGLIKRLFGRR